MQNVPKILCLSPAIYPPFIINICQPLDVLKRRGALDYTAIREEDASIHDVLDHDAVIFFRSSSPVLLRLLHFAKLSGKPVIYVVDDNFFELAYSERGALNEINLNAHSCYIGNADVVIVYSDLMMNQAGKFNKKVIKAVPGIDLSSFAKLDRPPCKEKVKIVYPTSRFKRDILSELFIPALERIFSDYPALIEMDFWGYMPKELIGQPGVNFVEGMDYQEYINRLYTEGFDIGLAPLKEDVFHRSKTNTKFRDYGACRIAGIYSDVDVYSGCVKDGETGLLVKNTTDDWYQAIKRLIEDAALRESIKANAYEYVKTHYDMERVASDLHAVINDVFKKTRNVSVSPPKYFIRRFLDIKRPRILGVCADTSLAKELSDISKHYKYKIKLADSLRDAEKIDIVVLGGICEEERRALAAEATALKKGVIEYDIPLKKPLVNLVEELYFGKIIKEKANPYILSFEILSQRLKLYRSFISRVLFKETGLNTIEIKFRRKVLKPIKSYAAKYFPLFFLPPKL